MALYIVDASVILKWVVGQESEPDLGPAHSLLDAWRTGNVELAAPSLWPYEVGNFLGRQLGPEAGAIMEALLRLQIRSLELTETMYQRCFAWMGRHGVTFYDAAYLTVAVEFRGTLITTDRNFAQRMKHPGQVCLLEDFRLA